MGLLVKIFFLFTGIITILGIAYLLSAKRKAIRLRPILWGLGLQITFGVLVLYWPVGNKALIAVADGVARFLSFAAEGSKFLFGNLGDPTYKSSPLFWAGDFQNMKGYQFSLDIKHETCLNNAQISEELKEEFKKKKDIDLSKASVEIQQKDSVWLIKKDKEEYLLKKEGDTLNIYTKSFAGKLRDGKDPLSKYLQEQFSPDTQEMLKKYEDGKEVSAELNTLLISELNKIIQGSLIYEQQRFSQIKLSKKVEKMLTENLKGDDLVRLNRFCLEEAYPETIKWYQDSSFGFQFAFIVLCTIIFFSSFMSILYHYGVMQKVVAGMAWMMAKTMGTSGSESLVAAANVFVGQTEAPLIVRPFIKTMTMSELTAVMVSGFGTIAGGVMAGYIAMGVPAQYIITASLMAAPASLVMAKILFPETEQSATAKEVKVKLDIPTKNGIEAAAKGASDGLQLALNVGAMLVAFIALIYIIDAALGCLDYIVDNKIFSLLGATVSQNPHTGEYVGIVPGSLRTLLSTILWPVAWLMGVPKECCSHFAYLVGIKLSLNEFFAYIQLSGFLKTGVFSELLHNDPVLVNKVVAMSTFVLCGFANFASIAIQIGGITPMVAPEEQDNLRSRLASLGVRAMLGGALVSCLTATIAGFLLSL